MFRGSKKDPRFATRCFVAEENTAQNNAWRLKKRLCSFSGPHCGAEKKLEAEKKTCRGRKQDGPIARSRKRHFGVEKKSSPYRRLRTVDTDGATGGCGRRFRRRPRTAPSEWLPTNQDGTSKLQLKSKYLFTRWSAAVGCPIGY